MIPCAGLCSGASDDAVPGRASVMSRWPRTLAAHWSTPALSALARLVCVAGVGRGVPGSPRRGLTREALALAGDLSGGDSADYTWAFGPGERILSGPAIDATWISHLRCDCVLRARWCEQFGLVYLCTWLN